jgi:hypothetical protein
MTINAMPKPFQFCFLLVPPTNSYKIKLINVLPGLLKHFI